MTSCVSPILTSPCKFRVAPPWARPELRRLALTLLEGLVVLAILAVLLGLLLPTIQKVRESANRVGCSNNLKQMGIALHSYHTRQGAFPPGYRCKHTPNPNETAPGWGWAASLLPDLDEETLAGQIFRNLPMHDPANLLVRTSVLRTFVCPSDLSTGVFTVFSQDEIALAQAATNSYSACFGVALDLNDELDKGNGMFFRNSHVRLSDVTDGTSNTIALGERSAMHVQSPWAGAVSNGTTRITGGALTENSNLGEEAASQVLAQLSVHKLNDIYSGPDDFFSPHDTRFSSSSSMARSIPCLPIPVSSSCAAWPLGMGMRPSVDRTSDPLSVAAVRHLMIRRAARNLLMRTNLRGLRDVCTLACSLRKQCTSI